MVNENDDTVECLAVFIGRVTIHWIESWKLERRVGEAGPITPFIR